ncbi:F-box/kelch-repeat protein [Raphanus sativus]|uniref:F-box/kelch-repeat protein At5g51250-like n=1 Tax=Raphanus sativus TaxID=3726 RepID=A0A9W3CCB2_RAPSA|nr:F-box/kelch-repeat protein At5g51250-like [Raphanus sativus]KAJ4911526.1 F-box/kelch-repeat protein [Raphanus sativus]
MVASPELYKVRSLLGLKEIFLYVCLKFELGSSYKWYWYTLSSKSSCGGYVLGRVLMVPDADSPCMVGSRCSDLVAVGSDIYNIGTRRPWYSGVSILDCKSHTWRKAPPMPVDLDKLFARVVDDDGKIYVLGRRYLHDSCKISFLAFNTDTQTWDLPCHRGVDSNEMPRIVDIEGKLHAVTVFDGMFAFNSKQGRWDLVEQYPRMTDIMCSESYCEIDNVLYSVFYHGALRWYDTDKKRWRSLKGLVGLPEFPTPGHGSFVKLTGYGGGGKMMVFWNRNLITRLSHMDTIYCAEIALERRNGDCWGKLEWCGGVLSVPLGTEFVKVLAVTL